MNLRILVLGAGGTGGFFGGRLAQAGANVTFLVRKNRKAQLAGGLRIQSPLGDALVPVQAKLASEVDDNFDLVLLTCKAYDLDSAIESVRPAMTGHAGLLPLLNGIAHIDRLNAVFGEENVIPGTAKVQATLSPDGAVHQLSDWQTVTFGEQNGKVTARVAQLQSLFEAANLDARVSPCIVRDLWWKLVHLATVAGMTSLMRANLGEIVRTPEGGALLQTFFGANTAIAASAGYPPDTEFLAQYRALFRQRHSTYEASMLRDIERGGPIESEHILGFMLRKCREAGLPDLLHLAAYTQAKAYEERRSAGRLAKQA